MTLATGASAEAATFTVSNLDDSGGGSLRQAIIDADANPGADQVTFQSTLSGQITLGSQLPNITDPVDIAGPGAGKLTVSGDNNSRIFYLYPTVHGTPVTISGLTLTAGKATGQPYPVGNRGGAIFSKYAKLTVQDVVISNSSTTFAGGAIESADASLTVRSSTITGNSASEGGGISVRSDQPADATIENSTITGNQADFTAGGVWFENPFNVAQLTVRSTTIAGNSVTGTGVGPRGGGFSTNGHGSSLVSTIVADNTAPQQRDVAAYSPYASVDASFSLIENPDGATITGGPNIFGQDPQLGPLANNGGQTQTEAPSASSPAIDTGASSGLSSDQRGVLRPIDFPAISNTAGGDGSDIGAVELQPSNAFSLGKLKRNKHKGIGKQVVKLPLPDAGSVTIKGKGMKTKTRQVTGAPKLKLPVIPKGKKKGQENATGSVKLKAKITYKPTGNAAKTLKRKLKLLKSV